MVLTLATEKQYVRQNSSSQELRWKDRGIDSEPRKKNN